VSTFTYRLNVNVLVIGKQSEAFSIQGPVLGLGCARLVFVF